MRRATFNATAQDDLDRARRARRRGELEEAHRLLDKALQAAHQSNDGPTLVRALGLRGHIHLDREEFDEARIAYEQAVTIARSIDDPLLVAYATRHLGDVLSAEGTLERARALLVEAIDLYRQNAGEYALPLANALRSLALLCERKRNLPEADYYWREARAIYAHYEIAEGVAECDDRLARGD